MDASKLVGQCPYLRNGIDELLDATGLDEARRSHVARILLTTVVEIARVAREGIRGNTTVKVCHPEGTIKKAFLNDREM